MARVYKLTKTELKKALRRSSGYSQGFICGHHKLKKTKKEVREVADDAIEFALGKLEEEKLKKK